METDEHETESEDDTRLSKRAKTDELLTEKTGKIVHEPHMC